MARHFHNYFITLFQQNMVNSTEEVPIFFTIRIHIIHVYSIESSIDQIVHSPKY